MNDIGHCDIFVFSSFLFYFVCLFVFRCYDADWRFALKRLHVLLLVLLVLLMLFYVVVDCVAGFGCVGGASRGAGGSDAVCSESTDFGCGCADSQRL